jgi:hypothetical protein
MHLKLVVNNDPVTKKVKQTFLKGPELHKELQKLGTVEQREQLVVKNLEALGF